MKLLRVEMFHSCTESSVKEQIIKSFTDVESHLQIVVATIALEMGLDCPNIRRVIHFGLACCIENYIQVIG